MPDRNSRGRRGRSRQPERVGTRGKSRHDQNATRHSKGGSGFPPGLYAAIILGISAIGVIAYFTITNQGFQGWLSNIGRPDAVVQSAAPTPSVPDLTAEPVEEATPTPTPTPTPMPTPTPTPDTILTISAVGDIMMHGPELTAAYDQDSKEHDFNPFFAAIKEELSGADLTIGNLETTISVDGKYSGYPRFSSPESLVPALKDNGFDIITTSNNHSYDKGYKGLVKTLETLESAGLAFTGTFRSKEEYRTPLIVEANGLKVAVLAYTYAVNTKSGVSAEQDNYAIKMLNMDTIETDVKASRENGADIVIVSVHWGKEYTRAPSETMEQQAEEMLKVGADLVLGSHPHMMQPIRRVRVTRDDGEEYEGVVAFSMGNFISNQTDRYKDSGMILNATFRKDATTGALTIEDVSYVPTWVLIGGDAGYQVLPVGKYLDDEALLEDLDGKAQNRLQEVWNETTELIGDDIPALARAGG